MNTLTHMYAHHHHHHHHHHIKPVSVSLPAQDDGSPGGVCDPVLAAVEVHSLPAAAVAGVQMLAGRSQEGGAQTRCGFAAAQEGLA